MIRLVALAFGKEIACRWQRRHVVSAAGDVAKSVPLTLYFRDADDAGGDKALALAMQIRNAGWSVQVQRESE